MIYYLKHMLQDMDEEQMLSRALISYVRFNHPQTIMHPILTFSLDLLWEKLAKRFFLMDRVLTMFNCIIFILAECILNAPTLMDHPVINKVLAGGRFLVYSVGFCRLLYWHSVQCCRACKDGALTRICGVKIPQYLTRSSDILSLLLMMDLLAMMTVEPMFHCMGKPEEHPEHEGLGLIQYRCEEWTDEMSLLYEIFVILGVFLYVILILEVGSISVKLSEYRVLCLHAIEQVLLCFGVVLLAIFTFSFAISGMTREVHAISNREWDDVGASLSTLIRLAFGAMDLEGIQEVSKESPLLIIVIVLFMMLVYSFFFNLLVSQFCGVYTSLAADIKGHARLARGEIIIETFKAVKLSRWQKFMASLDLDTRVDFEEGDIGLAGGIKDFEPALAHPVAKDQIIRFGGRTDGHLPWPEKNHEDEDNMEKMIQRTIQKSLSKMLGKGGKAGGSNMTGGDTDATSSSHHSSGKNDAD